jgi:hypothetical protein
MVSWCYVLFMASRRGFSVLRTVALVTLSCAVLAQVLACSKRDHLRVAPLAPSVVDAGAIDTGAVDLRASEMGAVTRPELGIDAAPAGTTDGSISDSGTPHTVACGSIEAAPLGRASIADTIKNAVQFPVPVMQGCGFTLVVVNRFPDGGRFEVTFDGDGHLIGENEWGDEGALCWGHPFWQRDCHDSIVTCWVPATYPGRETPCAGDIEDAGPPDDGGH